MKRILHRYWYVLLTFLYVPSSVHAAGSVFEDAKSLISGPSGLATKAGISVDRTPAQAIGSIINTAIGILGVIAVLLIVYAGGLWLTAAGNDDKVSDAKKIIRTTVVGIVIVGMAYAIASFIITAVA